MEEGLQGCLLAICLDLIFLLSGERSLYFVKNSATKPELVAYQKEDLVRTDPKEELPLDHAPPHLEVERKRGPFTRQLTLNAERYNSQLVNDKEYMAKNWVMFNGVGQLFIPRTLITDPTAPMHISV